MFIQTIFILPKTDSGKKILLEYSVFKKAYQCKKKFVSDLLVYCPNTKEKCLSKYTYAYILGSPSIFNIKRANICNIM